MPTTRYEAYTHKNWREIGMTEVIVGRLRSEGNSEVAFFFVDVWCLGVKEAFLWEGSSEAELRDLVTEKLAPEDCERIHPACAKKLIEGAIAYAEKLGFAPHRDYRKARRALSGVDAADCPETFFYGRNGKPVYAESPDDSPERVERVLAILESRCGADGFIFERFPDGDEDEGGFDASRSRAAVRDYFADPENNAQAKSFFEASGMISAMILSRAPLPPTRLTDLLWPGQTAPGRFPEEGERFLTDLLGYWTYLVAMFMRVSDSGGTDPGATVPDIFAEDFKDQADLPLAYIDWAAGFTRMAEGFPADWAAVRTNPKLAAALRTLKAWGDPGAPEHKAFFEESRPGEAPDARNIGAAVLKLVLALGPKSQGQTGSAT